MQERLDELLKQAGEGRAGLKRAASRVDHEPPEERRALREALLQRIRASAPGAAPEGEAEGDEEEAAAEPSTKRLLRWALGREDAARRPGNPTHRDEAFTCAHCGAEVPRGGARVRDHCPACLHGLHVDGDVPGDRAARCGGELRPTGLERRGEQLLLTYTCALCGVVRRVRAHPDDDPGALRSLSAATGWRAIR